MSMFVRCECFWDRDTGRRLDELSCPVHHAAAAAEAS